MKIQTRGIDAFLKSPPSEIRAILVYGPDAGLVRERARMLAVSQVADINDPFNAAHLTGPIIADDPARFGDEADAGSLMGGKRLVRVTDAGNEIGPPLKNWLKNRPSPDTLVVIEGGDLKPRDVLRKICEDHPAAAALPCYVEDERQLSGFIRETLGESGIRINSEAAAYLAASVKGDRARVRAEIEKLVLYMGDGNSASLDDVRQSCGDTGAYSIEDLTFAFSGGNKLECIRALKVLLEEGTDATVILRSLQNQILRFHLVRNLVDGHGQTLDEAMKSLQPPIFFKAADRFRAQFSRWSGQHCRAVLSRLNDAEFRLKQTGAQAETLLSQFLLSAA